VSSRKPPVREQVKRGFLHAGEIVGGMLLCALAMTGFIGLFSEAPARHFRGPLTAWVELGLATIIIFATAERWAGYVPGFLFLTNVLRGFSFALIPPGISHPFHSWSRLEWLAFGTYFALAIGLLWRFVPPRKMHATLLDRVALTIFALSFLILGAIPISVAFKFPVIGLAALLIAWMAYRFDLSEHRRLATHASRELAGKVQ